MDSILLQKQIRNNAADLQDFYKEISEWGEEMKEKDDLLKTKRNKHTEKKEETSKKVKKQKVPEVKTSIKRFDYAAWDKYDADAECEKLDQEANKEEGDDSGELSDEFDENTREQAILEKEKGNKFVKNGKWEEAIKCYTQAIEYYGYDPIFYANRALCHLKKQNLRAAESDCTVALQLDKTYVKAYQRRAAAREGLNQLKEALEDLLKVFDYEPNNKESKAALAKLEKKMKQNNVTMMKVPEEKTQRPKSKFTISRGQQKQKAETAPQTTIMESESSSKCEQKDRIISEEEIKNDTNSLPEKTNNIIEESINNKNYWSEKNDIEIIRPIFKSIHMRSKKPLKRIEIKETTLHKNQLDKTMESANASDGISKLPITNTTLICDELKVVERKENNEMLGENKNDSQLSSLESREKLLTEDKNDWKCAVPRTSVQFISEWKHIRNNTELRCQYLKQIKPEHLPAIFKDSLESDIFSDIIKTLAEDFTYKGNNVFGYLRALTQVRRFNTLVMFMSHQDKKHLLDLAEYLKSRSDISNEEIHELTEKYEL